MKYLLIFLPIFCFGQDTIVRGLDTMIIGRPYYDDHSFYKEWTRIRKHKDFTHGGDSALYSVRPGTVDTCWEIKNGWMSMKPGCISIPSVTSSGEIINFKEFYVSDRKPKVIESFKYLGAHYELRESGWYKEILLDTIRKDTLIPAKPRMKVATTWSGGWKYCDEHLGDGEIGAWRDSSSVNVLIWDGCKLIQKAVDKFENYTYSSDSFFFEGTLHPVRKDYSVKYAYKGKLIKSSYVIKEL